MHKSKHAEEARKELERRSQRQQDDHDGDNNFFEAVDSLQPETIYTTADAAATSHRTRVMPIATTVPSYGYAPTGSYGGAFRSSQEYLRTGLVSMCFCPFVVANLLTSSL